MKKALKILIPIIILGVLWYQFGGIIVSRLSPILAPCKQPIAYTLGSFDTKFGISKSYFLDAVSEAEAVWEKPAGEFMSKELFQYEQSDQKNSAVKINLVYDYRQQATNKLESLGIVVDENKASYDSLKIKFNDLKTRLESAKSDYENRVASFNQKQKAYEAQVKYWNARGGAPKKEYDQLQAEKSELDREVALLQAAQDKINGMVEEINAIVVVINRLASALNLAVEKYNTTGAARGESFEEGVYVSEGLDREIDIYEFSSREKLVRVLAHELGHALGLDHVADPQAIMYELNQGNNKTLTATDLEALKMKCRVK